MKTSYENLKNAGITPIDVPNISPEYAIRTFALADFFQAGERSLVVVGTRDGLSISNPKVGHFKFFKMVNSKWVDNTSLLLADTTACFFPSKVIIADFNNDGKPDVFVACTGVDTPPFPGEKSRLLLSSPDGTYINKFVSDDILYMHGATAFDVNNDGFTDIVAINSNDEIFPVLIYFNDGSGNFIKDTTRIAPKFMSKGGWYNTEGIDIDGNGSTELIIGGIEPTNNGIDPIYSATTRILFNNQGFFNDKSLIIPKDDVYPGPLDFIIDASHKYLYVARANLGSNDPAWIGKHAVQRVLLSDMSSEIIYTHTGGYANGNPTPMFLLFNNNVLEDPDKAFKFSLVLP